MIDDSGDAETIPTSGNGLEVSSGDVAEGFGEDLLHALDLATWTADDDLAAAYARIEAEVRDAVAQENALHHYIRRALFPRLGKYHGAPRGAGVYRANLADLRRIHRDLLFSGRVEACDGTRQVHDTLPVTIHQIGVCLVSYLGNQGSWGRRLFRRDLRVSGGDPVAEMLELLERREPRNGLNQTGKRDTLSELAGRGIMAYAERAILLHRSEAAWRMGHGNPAPYELITGSGNLDFMVEATKIIRALVEGHQKFVFVTSEPSDRLTLSIGQALDPLHFAVVRSLSEVIDKTVAQGHYRMKVTVDMRWDGHTLTPGEWIARFRDEVASQVVVGVYRATRLAPPQIFYAHVDHVDIAAHIAMADSILQEHRGFPMLIDLAHENCSRTFGPDTLTSPVSTAYTEAGAPFRYVSERASRYN